MKHVYDDGGRKASGFKGDAGDCVCRAIAIATGLPYADVYAGINTAAKSERVGKRMRGRSSARTGVHKPTSRSYLQSLGWRWVPTMKIGQGCKVHLRADELPAGRLVVAVSRHLVAVVDGVIRDTHDCSRDGTRCVYGYYLPPIPHQQKETAMPKFEFEITKRLEIVTTVTVTAKDEEEAEAKITKRIGAGLTDGISYVTPDGWNVETDETDYQLR